MIIIIIAPLYKNLARNHNITENTIIPNYEFAFSCKSSVTWSTFQPNIQCQTFFKPLLEDTSCFSNVTSLQHCTFNGWIVLNTSGLAFPESKTNTSGDDKYMSSRGMKMYVAQSTSQNLSSTLTNKIADLD